MGHVFEGAGGLAVVLGLLAQAWILDAVSEPGLVGAAGPGAVTGWGAVSGADAAVVGEDRVGDLVGQRQQRHREEHGAGVGDVHDGGEPAGELVGQRLVRGPGWAVQVAVGVPCGQRAQVHIRGPGRGEAAAQLGGHHQPIKAAAVGADPQRDVVGHSPPPAG